jgi:hypothetical protein
MAELHLPVDFERLPEFRQLCEGLARVQTEGAGNPLPAEGDNPLLDARARGRARHSGRTIEAIASHLMLRLWVELSYQAQVTNKPGLLTPEGAALFANSVDALFGDDCDPVKLLVESWVLV